MNCISGLTPWHRERFSVDPTMGAFVGDRIVFNIGGNKYRLVAGIDYRYRTVYVKWVGNHSEYDKIDVRTV